MDRDLHRRASALFLATCERSKSERESFLAEACAGDLALIEEVHSLLAAHERMTGFLETPALGSEFAAAELAQLPASGSTAEDLTEVDSALPKRIGSYRVLGLLGRGGMGAVYLAEQEQPQRRVALKIVPPGLATPSALRRFAHEAELLGRLQHPGIAQVYEAGTALTDLGPQPFFALELVNGSPLTEHAREKHLGVRARMLLFERVCQAVQHAHNRGVIHRDLKPANILVDETGQPKILDFGVARSSDADLQPGSFATREGEVIGTLAYMSPEQVDGDRARIDVRTDVYSLGVILYELLADRLPLDLSHTTLSEAARRIREVEPTALGARNAQLRGDVETIAARALEKDRERRYPSAAELAADVRRYLADEPILARPASTAYQLSKFARRHRGLVSGLVATFAALVLGIAGTSWQALRATDQKNAADAAKLVAIHQGQVATEAQGKAQREARTTSEALGIVAKMFHGLDSDAEGVDVSVRHMLERSRDEFGGMWTGEPEVGGVVLGTLSDGFCALGLWKDAADLAGRAVPLLEQGLGPAHPKTVQALSDQGYYLNQCHRFAEAQRVLELALQRWDTIEDPKSAANPRWDIESRLALVYEDRGDLQRALPALIDLRQRVCEANGAQSRQCLQTVLRLQKLYGKLFRWPEELEILEEVLPQLQERFGTEDSDTLNAESSMGTTLVYLKRSAEGIPYLEHVLEVTQRRSGDQHTVTLLAMSNVAWARSEAGEFNAASDMYEIVFDRMLAVLGPTDPRTLNVITGYAQVRQRQNLFEEAAQIFRRGFDALEASPPEAEDTRTMTLRSNFFTLLMSLKRVDEAGDVLEKSLAAARARLAPEHRYHSVLAIRRAHFLMSMGNFEEAECEARAAVADLESRLGDERSIVRYGHQLLSALYTRWGKRDLAQAEDAKLKAMAASEIAK